MSIQEICLHLGKITHYTVAISYMIKHWRGKHLWLTNNIHYVRKTSAVCPQPPVLVFYLQSRKTFSSNTFTINENMKVFAQMLYHIQYAKVLPCDWSILIISTQLVSDPLIANMASCYRCL